MVALSKEFYLNGAAGLGYSDYYNIERSFQLGDSRENYKSDTTGDFTFARIGGGAMFRISDALLLNPNASITYESQQVDGYVEPLAAAIASLQKVAQTSEHELREEFFRRHGGGG